MAIDLDRLTLSPYQVSQLYKKSLVVTGEPMGTAPAGGLTGGARSVEPMTADPEPGPVTNGPGAPPKEPLRYLGENKRHILLLVRDPDNVYLAETAFNFLLSILNACGLSMEGVALVNTARTGIQSLEDVVEELGSRYILLFGIDGAEIGLQKEFPTYEVQTVNKRTYLAADDLAGIAGERTQKGRLWACLKQLFDI